MWRWFCIRGSLVCFVGIYGSISVSSLDIVLDPRIMKIYFVLPSLYELLVMGCYIM